MSRFCLHHCQGSGGNFIVSMIAQTMGITPQKVFDNQHADYHQSTLSGEWAPSGPDDPICYTEYRGRRNVPADIYYTHSHLFILDIKAVYLRSNDDIKIIAIDADEDDFGPITTLYIKKAFHNLWTKQEYDRWVSTGCNFPPYDISNLEDPEVYSILHEQLTELTADWHRKLDHNAVDYIIKFKTVFGLDSTCLRTSIKNIVNKPVPPAVQILIDQYQQKNKELYFNA